MGEAVAEEGGEGRGFDAELGVLRVECPAQDGGVDLWRRGECARGQGEDFFNVAVELDGDGEQAVVAGAGLGGDTVGDFSLDHEHGAIDRLLVCDEMEQDVRGEVVGQIADYEEFFVWLRERGEVDVEDVALDDFDMGLGSEAFAEAGREVAVKLNRDKARGTRSEQLGDGGFAGSDFNDGTLGEIAESVDDGVTGRGADKEILSEFGFAAGRDGRCSLFGGLASKIS